MSRQRRLTGRDLSKLDVSDIVYLKETGQTQAYSDALRALVAETDILSDRQNITQSEQIFEDSEGRRKSIGDILRSFAGRNLEILPGSDRIVDAGYNNAATLRDQTRGKYLADVAAQHPPAQSVGLIDPRVKDVTLWVDDPVAMAYVDPAGVDLATATPPMIRAAKMGIAASQGDRRGVVEAQKRYEFTDEEVDEFLRGAKIGGAGFGSSIRKSGLDEGRALEVIDPDTGVQVAGSGAAEKEFYKKRIHQLTKQWLEGGATAFGEARSDIAIPGNPFQMEHDYPFSVSNATGKAETDENRVGFYPRYLNSEKSEIDPTTYYQMQRLAALAEREGVIVSGVQKGVDAPTSLRAMLEKVNPSVTQTGERRIKDRQDIYHPEREKLNRLLVEQALAPQSNEGLKGGLRVLDSAFNESGPGDLNVTII